MANPDDVRLAKSGDKYLREADLRGAYLSRTNLSRAKLGGAYLSRANLGGANLGEADLSRAKYDGNTQWPDGFNPEEAGAIKVDIPEE